jgi:2-polyprenyl-3-methyl-5-hydroxy-6-metoxy-1,4-benzoquinol methylase
VHVIEHVADVIRTMEELHRITRPGGIVFLVTPHYTDASSFTDPTHRRHLNSFSFEYFFAPGGVHGRDHFYTQARFAQRRLRVRLLKFWRIFGFEFFVNHATWFRRFWEFYLCYLIRGKVMEIELEVLKGS